MRNLISLIVVCLMIFIVAGGCNSDVTTKDVDQQKAEFSKDNMGEAMKASGKGAEWEEHKRKEDEYLKGGAGR